MNAWNTPRPVRAGSWRAVRQGWGAVVAEMRNRALTRYYQVPCPFEFPAVSRLEGNLSFMAETNGHKFTD